jgi:hypothetical protein
VSNTAGTIGSEIKRGFSATGNESKNDVKKAKKQ